MSPLTSFILNGTLNGEYLAIVEDKQGFKRLIGELNDGCTFTAGEQTNDKNGHPIAMNREAGEFPLYYTGAIPIA